MEWIYINDIETFVMKSVQLYQDERLWLQAKWYRNNQSSLRILFENDF
jgi:hypothetical protein